MRELHICCMQFHIDVVMLGVYLYLHTHAEWHRIKNKERNGHEAIASARSHRCYLHVLKLCKCRRNISFNHFARTDARIRDIQKWSGCMPLESTIYNGIDIRKMPSLFFFFAYGQLKQLYTASTETKTHVKLSVCCVLLFYRSGSNSLSFSMMFFLLCERIFCSVAHAAAQQSTRGQQCVKKRRFYEVCVLFKLFVDDDATMMCLHFFFLSI